MQNKMNIHPTLSTCQPKYGRRGSNIATLLLPSHHHHRQRHPSPTTIQTMSARHATRTLMTHSDTRCPSSPTTHNHHKNDARATRHQPPARTPGRRQARTTVTGSCPAQVSRHNDPPILLLTPTRCDVATRRWTTTDVVVRRICLQHPTTPPRQHATT